MKSQKIIVRMTVLWLAALIAAGCGGAEQRKSKYLAKGKDYMEQQNYDKAKIEFKNVLQIDPKYAEAYYQLVERTPIPFRQILDNIAAAARLCPLVIQSLFMRIGGAPPSPAELDAFCDRLCEIVAASGHIKLVQVYTVARPPAEGFVAALADAEVDAIVELVRRRTGLAAQAFYGKC